MVITFGRNSSQTIPVIQWQTSLFCLLKYASRAKVVQPHCSISTLRPEAGGVVHFFGELEVVSIKKKSEPLGVLHILQFDKVRYMHLGTLQQRNIDVNPEHSRHRSVVLRDVERAYKRYSHFQPGPSSNCILWDDDGDPVVSGVVPQTSLVKFNGSNLIKIA